MNMGDKRAMQMQLESEEFERSQTPKALNKALKAMTEARDSLGEANLETENALDDRGKELTAERKAHAETRSDLRLALNNIIGVLGIDTLPRDDNEYQTALMRNAVKIARAGILAARATTTTGDEKR